MSIQIHIFEEIFKPMSTIKLLAHIVFATKRREMTINNEHCEDLYRFINDFIRKNRCYLLRVNGIENHVHLLVDVNPQTNISSLIQQLKHDSSVWMYDSPMFPHWQGWCEGYFACSVTPKMKDAVIEYIKGQKVHHGRMDMKEEYEKLVRNAGLEFNGYYPE
jgi:REP element-mobilizing transposase RayT